MTERHQFGPYKTIPNEAETANMGGCLTRLVWLVAAPLGLLMLGAVVARDGQGVWSIESGAYWAVVVLALGVRYLDVVRFQGQTVDGKPASKQDWRRYGLRFPLLALAGWAAAIVLGET